MKRSAKLISGIAVTLLLVAADGWLFAFAKLNIPYEAMQMRFLPLAAFAVGVYLLNAAVMRRGVRAPVFFLLQLALAVAAGFLFRRCIALEPFRLRTALISGAFYCLIMPLSAYLAFLPLKKESLITCFEILVSLICISLLLDHTLELPCIRASLAMDFVALGALLLALIADRAGYLPRGGSAVEGSAYGGKLLLGLAFAAVAGLTAAAAALAATGIERFAQLCAAVLQRVWQWLLAVLRWLYGLLEQLMEWLARFYTPEELEPIGGMEGMGGLSAPEETMQVPVLPQWVYWALGAAVLALFLFVLLRLRRHRFARIRVTAPQTVFVRRESAAKAAFLALLRKLRSALHFRLDCLRYRRSAPALLLWCEKRVAKPRRRTPGESGEAFLLRLAAEEDAAPLRALAAALERTLYAPQPEPVPRELYRSVKRLHFSA